MLVLACPDDSEKNLDDLFETDCAYNGCTSPSPMLYLDFMSPTCFIHDVCYICGPGVVNQNYCNDAFYTGRVQAEDDRVGPLEETNL